MAKKHPKENTRKTPIVFSQVETSKSYFLIDIFLKRNFKHA